MSWSGGSVSFSGGPSTYSVSYSDPSYTFPPGTSYGYVYVSSAGPTSISCGNSVSQSYTAQWWDSYGAVYYNYTSISGTAPSCPEPPSYPPVWTDLTLAIFTATVVYDDEVMASNMNYSGAYSISTGSLPTGISLNTSNGDITGTPTVSGQNYNFTVRAANSYGAITANFSGTVGAAPTAGKLKVYNGTSWAYGPAKVYNGSAWVTGTVKVFNGTGWVTSV